jgi:hypothetical protein
MEGRVDGGLFAFLASRAPVMVWLAEGFLRTVVEVRVGAKAGAERI